jgi:predicted PurR-regulated permease PerM
LKKPLITSALALLGPSLAVIATVVLTPLWRWLEAKTGLESVGHSAPSTWCFIAVYLLLFIAQCLRVASRAKKIGQVIRLERFPLNPYPNHAVFIHPR